VVVVSAVPYDRIKRLRYSTADDTLVGAVNAGRAVCVRHPAPARTMWSQNTYWRSHGHPAAGVAIGPLPNDPQHATAFEFRFPEATAHARPRQPLEHSGERPTVGDGTWTRTATNAPALPPAECPPWATSELTVGLVREPSPDDAIIKIHDGERIVLCRHQAPGWRCFPSLEEPKLSEVEPDIPPQDRRLPPSLRPFLLDANVACDAGGDCTLMLVWLWQRDRIAHTYFWEGRFVSLYRVEGNQIHLLGRLRTFIRANDNNHRSFRDARTATLLSPALVELTYAPPPANLWPDSEMKPPPDGSPYALAPPGRYRLRASDISREEKNDSP
jgi:hypothetical protein